MIDDKIIALSVELINKFGSTITIQTTTDNYNVATGEIEESVAVSSPIKAIIDSYTSQEIDGIVKAGDVRFSIANNNINISVENKILFSGKTFNIVNVMPSYLMDSIVMYEVQARL